MGLMLDIVKCLSKLGDYSFDYLIKGEESPNTLSWLELMSLSAMDKRIGGNTPRLRGQRCEQRRHGSKGLRYPLPDKLPINGCYAAREMAGETAKSLSSARTNLYRKKDNHVYPKGAYILPGEGKVVRRSREETRGQDK